MLYLENLKPVLEELKIPAFRAKQIIQAVYKQGKSDFDDIKELPLNLRESLKNIIKIYSIQPLKKIISTDQSTEKVLFSLSDGLKIEAVLMRYQDGRNSVCVSSQAGCQLGCTFCATGKLKFGRNLTFEEICEQLLYFKQKLNLEGKNITNIVFMGMGEPFMNYDNLMKSIHYINHKDYFDIGARRLTISTAGICEGIEKLAIEPLQLNLAVSLHAPNQTLRSKIMPIARKYSLEQLMNAINLYLKTTNRRVSYEYVMLRDVNDTPEHAAELANLIKHQLCHVNLIPYNTTGNPELQRSDREKIVKFKNLLKEKGINATIRITLGQEIDAACGQLANKSIN